jgi:aryl-alcohol dehydrogenase-like predicted oxidoreductase
MRKRTLGATGLEVTELALGTWGLSGEGYGPVPETEQDAVIERALACGVTLFETADTYANGEMERRLGRLLPKGDAICVATKIGTDTASSPSRKRFDAATLKAAAERSRERLGRERIDILLLHNPSAETLTRGEATRTLAELCASGVAKTWGVSVGTPEGASEAVSTGAPVIELPHNAFHTRDLLRIAQDVKEKNIGILAHSVLAYGLLSGAWPMNKTFEAGDHRAERWDDDQLRRRVNQLNALRPTVLGTDGLTSLRAVALRYVLAEPLVSSVVLGPRKMSQLDQLVRDAGKDGKYFPEGIRETIDLRVRHLGVKP